MISTENEIQQDIDEDADLSDNENILCEYISIFTQQKHMVAGDNRVLLYRGQPNNEYDVTPSVFRSSLITKEHELINELIFRIPDEFKNINSAFERLVKMQHYGLPTRLLDVTTNPLVALYFACISDEKNEGEVLVLCENMEHPDSVDVRRISELSNYFGSTENQMISFLQERNLLPQNTGAENISRQLQSTRSRKFIAVATPLNNERIKRQQGAFLLFGVPEVDGSNPFEKCPFDIKPLLSEIEADGLEWKITIPKEHKTVLIQELDAVGINSGFLFPELEHQAEYVRNKYQITKQFMPKSVVRGKLIKSEIVENVSYNEDNEDAGDIEWYEYECPCKKGRIIEEHENIPGFREHYVRIECDTCSKKYKIDTSKGIRAWKLVLNQS